jgi:hypothetical protein
LAYLREQRGVLYELGRTLLEGCPEERGRIIKGMTIPRR